MKCKSSIPTKLVINIFEPDNVFGVNDQSFVLNVRQVNLLSDNFSVEIDINSPNENIVLIGYKGSVPLFCQIDYGTDQDWTNYFNKF
tara:strand:+ start:198 stop:458 length:261 start_codon:yes stop_codon:yes gene_type:complete